MAATANFVFEMGSCEMRDSITRPATFGAKDWMMQDNFTPKKEQPPPIWLSGGALPKYWNTVMLSWARLPTQTTFGQLCRILPMADLETLPYQWK